jgi:hypothetical protein
MSEDCRTGVGEYDRETLKSNHNAA